MKITTFISSILALACLCLPLAQAASPAEEGAELYIISPANGALLQNPITIRFGLKGMGVAPAGIEKTNTGHHHLLIDLEELPALDAPVPAGEQHRHFGAGQTETTLELSPGKHTLQLLLGDHHHIPHNPPVVSEKITIHVNGD